MVIDQLTKKPIQNFYKKHNLNRNAKVLVFLRRFLIIVVMSFSGYFFRSNSIEQFFELMGRFFTSFGFSIEYFKSSFNSLGLNLTGFIQIALTIASMILIYNFGQFKKEEEETILPNIKVKTFNVLQYSCYVYTFVIIYDEWALYVIKLIQKMSNELGILVPNIISENGKYAQKDSTVNIYKVITTKYTDKDYPWMIVDSSPLIAMPEMYALGEDILVEPINNIGDNMTKVRLGGLTCDCDDVYFEKDKGYILIPDNGTDQYIALIGTGSYQNSMNGKGGVHHCLLPEEKDILIYSDESSNIIKKVRHNIQSIDDIFKLIGLENPKNV